MKVLILPYDPKKPRGKGLADVPGTWGTFEQALRYLNDHKNNGIRTLGFEMGESISL